MHAYCVNIHIKYSIEMFPYQVKIYHNSAEYDGCCTCIQQDHDMFLAMHWCVAIFALTVVRSQVYSGQHCKMSEATHKMLLGLPGLSGRENKWHVVHNTVTSQRVRDRLEHIAAEKGGMAPVSVVAKSEDVEASFERDFVVVFAITNEDGEHMCMHYSDEQMLAYPYCDCGGLQIHAHLSLR